MEEAISMKACKVTKTALHNAFIEDVAAKHIQKKEQQNLLGFARLKMMHYKMQLPKLQTKKMPTKSSQSEEVRSKSSKEDILNALLIL